jgi:hypothetical protein
VSARIIVIIFHQLTRIHNRLYLFRCDHSIYSSHLSNCMGEKQQPLPACRAHTFYDACGHAIPL